MLGFNSVLYSKFPLTNLCKYYFTTQNKKVLIVKQNTKSNLITDISFTKSFSLCYYDNNDDKDINNSPVIRVIK
jgi:hypothetical protein